eukprot:m.422094 g.422094  ORF g.422094 m.422094 type:complete len:138 (-) comp21324_c0_seq4:804-1217(-)
MNLLPVTVDRHGMRASVAGHSTLDILASLQIPEWLQSLKRTLPARWPFNAFLDGVGSVLLMDRINALDGLVCGYTAGIEFIKGKVSAYTLAVVRAEAEEMIQRSEMLLLKYSVQYPIPFRLDRPRQHSIYWQFSWIS